jgi:glycogen(starch) synthase
VGVYVVNRKSKSFDEAADQLADQLYQFVIMNRRDRIMQRNRTENFSDIFDWVNLRSYYDTAHDMAKKKRGVKLK